MLIDEIKSAYHKTKWALVLRGLLGIALGIFIFARPLDSVAAFALVIALWAVIDGITLIVRAVTVRRLAEHWWAFLLGGIVSVLFGVAALYYYPGLSLTFAIIWSALWLLTAGAFAVYVAIMERRAGLSWGWTMVFGVLGIMSSVLAYMNPGVTLAWLMSLIAAFGIVGGVVMLVGAIRMQRIESGLKRQLEALDAQPMQRRKAS